MDRKKNLLHQINMIDKANDALLRMLQVPDMPQDLTDIPVGALSILKTCGISLVISGDNVFGIIDVEQCNND